MKYEISKIMNTSVPLVQLIKELDVDNYVQLIHKHLLSGKIKTVDLNVLIESTVKRLNYPFNTLRFLSEDVLKDIMNSLSNKETDEQEYECLMNKLKTSCTFIYLFVGESTSKINLPTLHDYLEHVIKLYLEQYSDVNFYSFVLWYMFISYIRNAKDNKKIFIKRYFLDEIGEVFDIEKPNELSYLKSIEELGEEELIPFVKNNIKTTFSINVKDHDFGAINIPSYEEIRELIFKTKVTTEDDKLSEESFFAMMDIEDSINFLIIYLLDYLYIFGDLDQEYNEERYVSFLLDYAYEAVSYYLENLDDFLIDNTDFYSFVGWYIVSKLLKGF